MSLIWQRQRFSSAPSLMSRWQQEEDRQGFGPLLLLQKLSYIGQKREPEIGERKVSSPHRRKLLSTPRADRQLGGRAPPELL